MRALPEAKLVHRENVAALRRLLEALAVRVDLRRPSCAGTLVRARACLQVPAWPGCEVISRAPRGAQPEPTL